jgi:hypothetical protein
MFGTNKNKGGKALTRFSLGCEKEKRKKKRWS